MKARLFGQKLLALTLALMLGAGSATAGLLVRESEGVSMTGEDGVRYEGTSGVILSGADSLLTYEANGVILSGADGVILSGADTANTVAPNGVTYVGSNTVRANHADAVMMSGADGVILSGADGVILSGADGVILSGADAVTAARSNGVILSGADTLRLVGADQIVAAGADGVFSVPPSGVILSGADQVVVTGASAVEMTGADDIVTSGLGVLPAPVTNEAQGLKAFDPQLAVLLNNATDDSTFNVVVTYHRPVTDTDLAILRGIGVASGTRYRALPMVTISANPTQIEAISSMAPVRSIWQTRTLQWDADTSRQTTGVTRAWSDSDLSARNNGAGLTGRGVTVAVLDTGLDSTHADLSGRVVGNVKLAEAQPVNATGMFNYPVNVEGLSNTDQTSGHGTFVSGVIAGDGARSGGRYKGVAPGAKVVGLSAGDVSLLYVLAGFDYLLERGQSLGVRVVNCSFSANADYNPNDPVNVATRLLTEAGVNVVFSAGNTGPGLNSMNPYAMAPWVISVGATDDRGRLADFSGRGVFGSPTFRPTLVAPGVDVVSLRSPFAPLTGLGGVAGADRSQLSLTDLAFYTTARGTSFSAPQVAGTVALLLEANPSLTPAQVRDILQRTATPLPNYYSHEVGAGMLNAHAAALEAAFPERRFGLWRSTLDRGQVTFIDEPAQKFSGSVLPGVPHETNFTLPSGALLASFSVAWGPVWSTNDLSLSVFDTRNTRLGYGNTINLPGLTGRRERIVLKSPAGGRLRVCVANTLALLATPQTYTGILDVARVHYAPLSDIDVMGDAAQAEARQVLRTFVMFPSAGAFSPAGTVSRVEFAGALVRGAHVPQYLPARASHPDVIDSVTANYAESALAAPSGPLFYDAAAPGTSFRPDDPTTRLAAAVALVRAAGLRHEAENFTGSEVLIADLADIPPSYVGYVNVAIARGLIVPQGSYFRPNAPLTRAELAHAMVTVARLAVQ
ncbi:MAG TPA: S8 family serine peptidase [Pyrinomonadaceae bacterium]|nr:S8 family serine peptidase [Pyrinomonadaceae bacterium]